jgi:ribosomal protein L40E
MAYYGGPVVRVLSTAFDLMLFSSLAFLVVGSAGNDAFLLIIFALGGIIVQVFFLRRFRTSQRRRLRFPLIGSISKTIAETKICRYCDRAIAVDAKICRFCLTEIDERPASSAQVTSQNDVKGSISEKRLR